MKIDVSVIIISFNTKTLTTACINSVVNEGSSLKKEIIIVDNGSSDGSVTAIRELISKFSKSKSTIIENERNDGFTKANNKAIKIAQGEYILLLNSDTLVKSNSIGSMIMFAKGTKLAGVVGPKLLNPDGTVQASVFKQPTLKRAINQYWLGGKKILNKYSPNERDPVEVEMLVMAAFLITPQAKKKVGLLDERYFMYFEDHDYCRRVREAGLKVFYYPKALVIHHHGESGKVLSDEENQWRRLIPSSKIYHGVIKHYLLNFIIWSSQKWQRIFR